MDGMAVIDASSIDSALIGGCCYTMPLRILRTYRFSLYSISSSMRAGRTLLRNPPWSSASEWAERERAFSAVEGGIWLGLGSPCLMSSREKRGKGWEEEEEGKRETSMKEAVSSFTKTCIKPAANTQNERFTVNPDMWCE